MRDSTVKGGDIVSSPDGSLWCVVALDDERVVLRMCDHGGLLVTSAKATIWMFFGLFASYAAEFLLVWIERERSPAWLPLATYSPIAFCWFWRRVHE
jgi:hypothetical protein